MLFVEQRKAAGPGIDGERLDAASGSAVEFVDGAGGIKEPCARVCGEEEGVVDVGDLRDGFQFSGGGFESKYVQAFGPIVRVGADLDRDVTAGLI